MENINDNKITKEAKKIIALGPVEAFDFDKTIAAHTGHFDPKVVGQPIWPTIRRIRSFLLEGRTVVIFTASILGDQGKDRKKLIEDFCKKYIGQELPITNIKTHNMVRFWDDKAIHITPNKGTISIGVTDEHSVKGFKHVHGFLVFIENPVGSTRSGVSPAGDPWATVMQHAYGRISQTEGNDGDQVDVFLTTEPETSCIYVINQNNSDGSFDEHKVVMGAQNKKEAKDIYLANYQKGWTGLGSIAEMSPPEFDEWLTGDHTVPARDHNAGSLNNTGDNQMMIDLYFCNDCGWNGTMPQSNGCPICGQFDMLPLNNPKNPESDPSLGQGMHGDESLGTYGTNCVIELRQSPVIGWPTTSDAYADPAHFGFRIDSNENIHRAIDFYNASAGKKLRTAVNWVKTGKKIASIATDSLNKNYVLSKGKVVLVNDSGEVGGAGPSPMPLPTNDDMKCDGCGKMASPVDGKCPLCGASMSMGTTKDDVIAAADDLTDDDEFEFMVVDDVTDYELITDGLKTGELLKVRQLATLADAVNGNNRIYPRDVMQRAVDEARKRARVGAMLSEYKHPKDVTLPGGTKAYVDNDDRKTARVDDIEDVQPNGKVYVQRTILDTPYGKVMADSYRNKRHKGLSNRYKMRAHRATIGGRDVQVADELRWCTTDDVDTPAFPETVSDYLLITDEQRAELQLPPAISNTSTTVQPVKPKEKRMNEKIKAEIGKLYKLIRDKAPAADVLKARQAVSDEVRLAERGSEDISDAIYEELKADDAMRLSGYDGGRPAPIATMGNKTGSPGNPGHAADIESKTLDPGNEGNTAGDPDNDPALHARGDEATEFLNTLKAEREAKIARKTAKADKVKLHASIDEKAEIILAGVEDDVKATIVEYTKGVAKDEADIENIMTLQKDSMMKILAKQRLAGAGFTGATNVGGQTIVDPANPRIRLTQIADRGPSYMDKVEKILAAADDHCRHTAGIDLDPDDPLVKSIRARNREQFINPLLEKTHEFYAGRTHWTADSWASATDEALSDEDKAICDALERASTAFDDSTTANLYNQPTILTALIVQMFQDMQALQFVDTIGPGVSGSPNEGGWTLRGNYDDGRVGAVVRIPFESYTNSTGYGTFVGPQFDAGMLFPENVGIDPSAVNITWLEFPALFRRGAVAITKDVVVQMGQGPLNYSAIGRHLFHLGWDKSRRIDKALLDEMLLSSDEFQFTTVASESPNLTYNSVYNAAGNITVNLNPLKSASTAVSTTDASVTYSSTSITAIIRLQTNAGTGALPAAGPYCGTVNGVTPILRSRYKPIISNTAGLITNTTVHALSVTAPASQVEGYIDANGNIATKPADLALSKVATFAVDYENGLIMFGTGQVSGSSGIVTTTVTVAPYYYVNNFDNFIVNSASALGLFSNSLTFQQYLEGLLAQFDVTAAKMGSSGRYVKPNLAIMSLNASTFITQAATFWQLHSPKGTNLFPTESFFMERNGIMGARINAPWYAADRRILFNRRGSTKYAISQPWDVTGPYPAYDTSGRIIPKVIFYGEELSMICTPEATALDGITTLNPVGRSLILR